MKDKDLEKVERELVSLSPEERQRDLQKRAFSAATGVVFLTSVWLLLGGGYFWPAWPFLFGALDLMRRAYLTYANPLPELETPDEVDPTRGNPLPGSVAMPQPTEE